MKEQIGLGAFGTFGEPFGYQQVFFMVPPLHTSFDLNTNAIEVPAGAELYAVKRETEAGVTSVCCCLYTYAKESASNRGGTFVGTCVVLRNAYLKGEDVYTLLKELHTDVVNNPKNILDNTLQVQKAAQLTVTEPAGFNRIKSAVSATTDNSAIDTQSRFLIQPPATTDPKPAALFFDSAVRYFTSTDTLYFTTDKQIISYVSEKGIIPTVDWETFEGHKKQMIQQQKKAEAAKRERSQPVAKGTKPVAKTAANKNTAFGLLEPWTNVDTNLGREAFYKLIQNHNVLLQEYVKVSQQVVPVATPDNGSHSSAVRSRRRIKRKHLVITIFVLLALLLTTSVLLLLRPAAVPGETATTPPATDNIVPVQNIMISPLLVPLPNTELVKADVAKLAKDSIKGKKLDVIVDLLFIRNPKNIGEMYLGQKEAYAASLVRLNEKCFGKDSIEAICICDTLMHIPAFKK